VILSKTDLLGVIDDFDPGRAAAALRELGADTPMIHTASRRTPAIGPWVAWLELEVAHHRAPRFVAVPPRFTRVEA
jgi:hydrogenase nickel incorporation protein HypB